MTNNLLPTYNKMGNKASHLQAKHSHTHPEDPQGAHAYSMRISIKNTDNDDGSGEAKGSWKYLQYVRPNGKAVWGGRGRRDVGVEPQEVFRSFLWQG